MAHRALAVSLLLLGVAVVGCMPGETRVDGPIGREVVGRLEGIVEGDDQCWWLADTGGRRTGIVLPTGWDVTFEPLRLLDNRGRTFAEDGDVLRVVGTVPGGAEGPQCQPAVWIVADTVEPVSD